jgi:hypothetical protein
MDSEWIQKKKKKCNLEWATNHIHASDGVHLLRSLDWGIDNANAIILCNACPGRYGFLIPALDLGFYAPVPATTSGKFISVYEALCVLSVLEYASSLFTEPRHFIIFANNSNTVDMFTSLCAPPNTTKS